MTVEGGNIYLFASFMALFILYSFLFFKFYFRLRNKHPEILRKYTYRPTGKVEKIVYGLLFLNFSMHINAVLNIFLKRKYLETEDRQLINFGNALIMILILCVLNFVGGVVYQLNHT